MNSCLYFGKVRHRRRTPVEHAFTFPLFMLYLDLDELDRVFAGRWLWSTRRRALARFDARDHLGGGSLPLADVIRKTVAERTGTAPTGPIRLLTHLRYAGYVFNPVSFYYCFDADDERVETVVADVSNTPWGERHSYVLAADEAQGSGLRLETAKDFHVSPFMAMDLRYRWSFERPGAWLLARVENVDTDGSRVFDAALAMRRQEITGRSLARALSRHPFLTAQAHVAIYWQALRLWRKGAPLHPHPPMPHERGLEVIA